MSGNEIILQDSVDDVLVFVDVVNQASGCIDEGGNMVIINEHNPNTPTSQQYEVISNKVTGFTNPNNATYPTSLAVVTLVNTYGDKYQQFTQSTPENTWVILHNLNKRPSVTITNTSGEVIEGQVTYNTNSQITINFSTPISGNAELN